MITRLGRGVGGEVRMDVRDDARRALLAPLLRLSALFAVPSARLNSPSWSRPPQLRGRASH